MKKRDEELQKIQLSISEIDLSISEIEQRVNTVIGYEGPLELPPLFIDKPPPEVKPLLTRISILALARPQYTPALPRIPSLFALHPAHHLRR